MSKDKDKKPPTMHDSFVRLGGAIGTVIPPVERLRELSDEELLGFSWALDGHQEQLGKEWTLRQMELQRAAVAARES